MDLFKSFTMTWWQVGIFKTLLLCLGIVLGATWPEIFLAWRSVLLVIFAVATVYISWVWWKQIARG
ncbi:MAG: hypothetical protein WCP06_11290 [Verrucomicrobiota bacterium]